MNAVREVFAASFLACLSAAAQAGFLVKEPATDLHAVLVDSGAGAGERLEPLETVLRLRFGASVELITGAEATADRIELALDRAKEAWRPGSRVFVFFGMQAREHQMANVFATADFDPGSPWTGLPMQLVLDLFAPHGDDVWLVYPGCGTGKEPATGTLAAGGIAYCAADGFSGAAKALASALQASADAPLVEDAPVRSTPRRFVSNWVVAEYLAPAFNAAQATERPGAPSVQLKVTGASQLYLVQHANQPRSESRLHERYAAGQEANVEGLIGAEIKRYRAAEVTAESLAEDLRRIVNRPRAPEHAVLAVRALADLDPEVAGPELSGIFSETSDFTLKREIILHFPDPLPMNLQQRAMDSGNSGVRSALLERSLLRRKPLFPGYLRRIALETADENLRTMAIRTAAATERAQDTVALVSEIFAAQPAAATRRELVIALGGVPPTPDVVSMVIAAVGDSDSTVQTAAVYVLGSLAPDALTEQDRRSAGTALASVLAGARDPALEAAILDTAGRQRFENLLPQAIAAARNSRETAVQEAAMGALAQFASPQSIEALIGAGCLRHDCTAESTNRVRLAAIRALGRIDAPEASNVLWNFLVRTQGELRVHVLEALKQAPAGAARAGAEAVLGDRERPIDERRVAAAILAGGSEYSPLLLRSLADADQAVREHAVQGLMRSRTPASVERLVDQATSTNNDEAERTIAVNALAAMGELDAVRRVAEADAALPADFLVSAAAQSTQAAQGQLSVDEVAGWMARSHDIDSKVAGTGLLVRAGAREGGQELSAAVAELRRVATDEKQADAVREAAVSELRALEFKPR